MILELGVLSLTPAFGVLAHGFGVGSGLGERPARGRGGRAEGGGFGQHHQASVEVAAPNGDGRAVTTATLSDADFVFRVGKIGVTSNWSTFAKPLDLFKGSTQVLHVPILDWPKANPAGLLGSMLVFRPHEGRLAVMAAGDAAFVERLARSGAAGEKLDVEL